MNGAAWWCVNCGMGVHVAPMTPQGEHVCPWCGGTVVDRWEYAELAALALDGCTCGGIGSTGAHRPSCPWAYRRKEVHTSA